MVDKVVDVYSEGVSGCVDKMRERLGNERDELARQWRTDGSAFRQTVEESKAAMEQSRDERRKSMLELEKDVAERDALYDGVRRSIGAFQERIAHGKAQHGEI